MVAPSSCSSCASPPVALNRDLQDSLKIHDCIRMYRETIPSTTSHSHAAFGVTLGQEQLDSPESSQGSRSRRTRKVDEKSQKERKCVCQRNHLFSRCFYLNPAAAPKAWSPRETVQAKIVAEINGNARLRDIKLR
ncbi:hypothetical protein K402DRAFT_426149 [Aulographum hederae CBS 113979]|uniref:Uncharacterized protein n=1 Tax=Aulographum hederae CBS 113979 TaxID=1176131 RepID=A0A6G1GHX9_9PEZI|nr:hypothetical protein K402DRAFT_426149 [Aulographum hederae CBS 113979]